MIKSFLHSKTFNPLLIVILLTLIGLYLRLSNLGALSFHHDEFYMVSAAKGYLETGDFRLWDFSCNTPLDDYSGKWFYTWLVAKSFSIFGFSEFAARIPGAIIGTLTILLIYLIFSNLTSKSIALIASLLFTFDETAIYLSRFTRQYSFFLTSYLLMVFYAWKGYETHSPPNFFGKRIFSKLDIWYERYRIEPKFLMVGLAFFLLSYHLHPSTLNFIPSFLFYCLSMLGICYLKNSTTTKKYLMIIVSFSLLFTVVMGLNILGIKFINLLHTLKEHMTLNIYATYIGRPNFIYYGYLFEKYRFPLCANLFLIIGIIYVLKEYRHKGIYILSILFVPLLLSIYFWKRYEDFRYIYFLKPFAMLILSAGVVASAQGILKLVNSLIKRFKGKTTVGFSNAGTVPNILSIIICLLTLTFISFPGLSLPPLTVKAQADWTGPEGYYRIHRRTGVPNYKAAYKYISQQAQEKDLLIVQGGTGIIAGIYLENEHPWNINYLPWRSSNLYYKPPSSVPSARYNDQAWLEVDEFLLPYSFWDAISQYDSGWVVFPNPKLLNASIVNFVTNHMENVSAFLRYWRNWPYVYRWRTSTPIEAEVSAISPLLKEAPRFFTFTDRQALLRHYIRDRYVMPGKAFSVSLYLQIFPIKKMKLDEQESATNAFCSFKFKLIGSEDSFLLSTSLVDLPYSLNKILKLENFLNVPENVPSGVYKLCLSMEEVGGEEKDSQNYLYLRKVFVANQTHQPSISLNPFSLMMVNLKRDILLANYLLESQEVIDENKLRLDIIWSSLETAKIPGILVEIGKKDKRNKDNHYFIQPKLVKRDLLFTKDNKKILIPLNVDYATDEEWQKGEVIREEYEVNLPEGLWGEYDVKMAMVPENGGQGVGSREQEVQVKGGDLYLLTPYHIYRGKLNFNNQNREESLNVRLGIEDLQRGKWTLEFMVDNIVTPEKEGDYKLGVVINGNEMIDVPVVPDRETERISINIPSKMLNEFMGDDFKTLDKEGESEVAEDINGNEMVEGPVTQDRQIDRILINIPRIMLKEGKNNIDFLLNTKQESGGLVVRDIKLVNKKRIGFADDNSISLGKVRLGEWKEGEGGKWGNPYHMVTIVKEMPEWVNMNREQIDLNSLVLLDYSYPEMREDRLFINLYWQTKDDECLNPQSLQLMDQEGRVAYEYPLLTPYKDWVGGEILEENLKLEIPYGLPAGWYEVVLSESGYGKQVLLGKVRLKGRKIIEDYTLLTTRDYGKVVSQKGENEIKPGEISLAGWDVRGNKVSLKWELEGSIINEDLQFVIKIEGSGKRYTQRYFPQKPVLEWREGENYWEDYRLVLPESGSRKFYKIGVALWDPLGERYIRLNGKKGFIHIGEMIVIKEKTPDGVLLKKSKEPFFFDENTLEAKVIDQLKGLRVKKLQGLNLEMKGLDSLKGYNVVVTDRGVSEEERRLLDEYVEAGGVVIESRKEPREDHVWELREGG